MIEREYQCAECEGWYMASGENGIIPHLLNEHPFGRGAQIIDEYLLEEILNDSN